MVSLLIEGGRNPSWILRWCCRHGLLLVSWLYSRCDIFSGRVLVL